MEDFKTNWKQVGITVLAAFLGSLIAGILLYALWYLLHGKKLIAIVEKTPKPDQKPSVEEKPKAQAKVKDDFDFEFEEPKSPIQPQPQQEEKVRKFEPKTEVKDPQDFNDEFVKLHFKNLGIDYVFDNEKQAIELNET